MNIFKPDRSPTDDQQKLIAGIFDVDGVLLASPHERAWREALDTLADPEHFTTAIYQDQVAGKPRLSGAKAALEALGVVDADRYVAAYAERKQQRLEELIHAKQFHAFPDALRLLQSLDELGWPMAVASSSKNANDMMRLIPFDTKRSLFDVFKANICGRDLPRGKPDPAIFLLAAEELHMSPAHCFVAEDSPAGIEAACAGGMKTLGVARLRDAAGLHAVGADMVVESLDEITLADLEDGRPSRDAA